MKQIKETTYKGTRILLGNEKRQLINAMIGDLILNDFQEISIPVIQYQETFNGKVGEENNNLMFNFKDRGDRDLCLAPEYTAIIQKLASTTFKNKKDVKLFYVQECFRGEKPQEGRYRQFTQLGVEVLNPSEDYTFWMAKYAFNLIHRYTSYETTINDYDMNMDVTRGLDYYKGGKGFEIVCPKLGGAKQLCGGGSYEGGIGFAIGIDRVMLLNNMSE